MMRPTGARAIRRKHSSLVSCLRAGPSEYMSVGCPLRCGGPKGIRSLFVGTPVVVLVAEDADRVCGGLGPAFHAELGEQGGHVVLHGLLGQEHPLADLPVGE